MAAFKTKKAQMMSTAVLLMFMLMLAELFAFLILSSNYSQLSTSRLLSASSQSVKSSLVLSSGEFAKSSLKAAILTLSEYEYNPQLRKGNFISNLSYVASNLMISGIMPNATLYAQNTISIDMKGLTLSSYNASILKLYGLGSYVQINETRPQIFQESPYSISVSYFENVVLNTTAGQYSFGIPVNATLNLTGLPDLSYAQKGIWRYMTFGNISAQVSQVGGGPAAISNPYSFAYGTVYLADPGSSCPSNLGSTLANSIILVTSDPSAMLSSGCENNFAGLITLSNTISGSSGIRIPYLGYYPGTSLSGLFTTGQSILLYGPSTSAYDIQNLQHSVANGYYFASPTTASYIDRVNGNLGTSSAQGTFTFSGYNRESALFNGTTSYLVAGNPASNSLLSPFVNGQITLSAWVFPKEGPYQQQTVVDFGTNGNSYCHAARIVVLDGSQWYGTVQQINSGQSSLVVGNLIPFSWNYLAMTFSNSGSLNLYLNGQLEGTTTATVPLDNPNEVNNFVIGSNQGTPTSGSSVCGGALKPFNGSIANVQVYNNTLTSAQIHAIYAQGFDGRPVPNESLVAWYPLNGNANDYSGSGNNAVPTNILFIASPSGQQSRYAATFDGTSYIDANLTSYFGSYNSFSASVWAYLTPETTGPLFGISGMQYMTSTTPSYNSIPLINTRGLAMNVTLTGNTAPAYETGFDRPCYGGFCSINYTAPSPGWYFLATTFDAASGKDIFYVDGAPVNQMTVTAYYPINSIAYFTTFVKNTQTDVNPIYNLTGAIANAQAYDTVLSSNQIMQLYSEGISGSPVASNNIVTWLPLDGNANDYSGNSHSGIPTNGFFRRTTIGINTHLPGSSTGSEYPLPGIGSCTNISSCFNSSSHNIYASSLPIIPKGLIQAATFEGNTNLYENISSYLDKSQHPFSISLWVYINTILNGPMFGVTDSLPVEPTNGGTYGLPWSDPFLSASGFTIYAVVSGINNNNPIHSNVPNPGWHYVTLTYAPPTSTSAGEENLYIDNIPTTMTPQEGTNVGTYNGVQPPTTFPNFAMPSTVPLYWATNLPTYSGPALPPGVNSVFQGAITNVQLYNITLSQTQINSLYKSGITGVPINYQNLIGWWPLQGNVNDYSGNGYPGLVDQNVTFPVISPNTTATANIWQVFGLNVPPR